MKSQEYLRIRPYLLGLVSNEEQTKIEEHLLTNNDFYEEVLIEEDELIDDYLAGQLSSSDRQVFESHFLATIERQKKVRFGKAFKRYATHNPAPAPSPLRWWSSLTNLLPTRSPVTSTALAGVVLAVLAGVLWLALKNESQQRPAGPHSIATAVLTPGMSRDHAGNLTKILITPDKDTVQLRLAMPAVDYQKYRVEILSAQGAKVWTGTDLATQQLADGKFIVLNLPENIFQRDDYQVRLSGELPDSNFEDAASYRFQVHR